jgi:iron-sulfur cluster assembly protein
MQGPEGITISESAIARIREIAAASGVPLAEQYLRVAVVPGGCSGLTYDLGWDTTRQEGDRELEAEGVRILMDRRSYLYLEGTRLDFSDGLDGKGFHFENPQAMRTCACGESFSL